MGILDCPIESQCVIHAHASRLSALRSGGVETQTCAGANRLLAAPSAEAGNIYKHIYIYMYKIFGADWFDVLWQLLMMICFSSTPQKDHILQK